MLPAKPKRHYPFNSYKPVTQEYAVLDPIYFTNTLELEDGDIVTGSYHWGEDLGEVGYTTEVLSEIDGYVWFAGWRQDAQRWGRGNHVIVDDRDKIHYVMHCHLSKLYVVTGQYVVAGQPIGLTGDTGKADGPHLHRTLAAYYNGAIYYRKP